VLHDLIFSNVIKRRCFVDDRIDLDLTLNLIKVDQMNLYLDHIKKKMCRSNFFKLILQF